MAKATRKVHFEESEENKEHEESDQDHHSHSSADDDENEETRDEEPRVCDEMSISKPKRTSVKPLNERQIQLIKQKHLQKESLKVIESLLTPVIEESYLKKCLALLCKSELDDLITERHLSSTCGYPLCSAKLTEAFNLKQKFKIDLRNRTIHKFEERVKYCSVLCMKSAAFLSDQMPDEPLWVRYNENDGYEGLYKKYSAIKFYHQRNTPEPCEVKTAVGQAAEKLIARQVKKTDFVTLPYIKDEHMEELRKSLFTLEIKERSSEDAEQ